MNIRVVRRKIKSVGNVGKITKAMQLVSAVKMKKSLTSAVDGKAYQEVLERMLAKIKDRIDPAVSPLLRVSSDSNRSLIIVAATNKGLCGAFNANLLRHLLAEAPFKSADFVTIGRKGASFINRVGGSIVADYSEEYPTVDVSAVITYALDGFLKGKYRDVVVYYNRFVSSLRSEPTHETLLPIAELGSGESLEGSKGEYVIEPAPQELIDVLLRSYIEERLRYILIQTEAGEHAARMIAMKNATDNAGELIYNLTLIRNKLRQQKITYELLDMTTAKESVESN